MRENRAHWNMSDDYVNLCNRCQTHGSLVRGVRACKPAQCFRNGSCRFHFPYPVTVEPAAFIDGTGKNARKTFAAVRNDPWLNQHARLILLGWRANVDLQPVLDREAARRYISKYASKPESLSESYHTVLQEFCSRLPFDQPAERAVQRLFARMAADRDISAQEAVHLLLGEPLVECSRSFVNLNAQTDAPHVLRDPLELDNDDEAFEEPFFSTYQIRPVYLGHLNAVQFCTQHSVSRRPFSRLFYSYILLILVRSQETALQASTKDGKPSLCVRGRASPPLLLDNTRVLTNGPWRNCDCTSLTDLSTNCPIHLFCRFLTRTSHLADFQTCVHRNVRPLTSSIRTTLNLLAN